MQSFVKQIKSIRNLDTTINLSYVLTNTVNTDVENFYREGSFRNTPTFSCMLSQNTEQNDCRFSCSVTVRYSKTPESCIRGHVDCQFHPIQIRYLQ